MDYGSSANNDSLVYAQWEAIHNPAIIGKVFQSDEDGHNIFDPGYVQAAKVLKRFIEKSGGEVEYIKLDNGDIKVTGYLVESIFFINVDYTFNKTEDDNIEQLLKYVTFLQNIGVGLYDAFSATKEPGMERLIWYGKKSDAMFSYDPPRFVTFTADWLFAQPYGVGPGTIISLFKGEDWRTGETYDWNDVLPGILISVVGKRLVDDGLVNAFFDLFASYSLNELESFYSQLDEESSVSKNIYGISALKKGFKNIFPVDKYSDFQRIEMNPARCFVEIEASEFYDEEWMTDISQNINNFNNSIVLDLETYMGAANNLKPTELLEFINDKIKRNKIKGMTIFYLD